MNNNPTANRMEVVKSKAPACHADMFGKEIQVGSFVVVHWWDRQLQLCTVEKLNNKTIKVRKVNSKSPVAKNRYSNDSVLIDNQEDILMYILKNSPNS